MDQEYGAYIGTKYLIEKGYTKIAYCTGGYFDGDGKGNERDKGFQKALSECDLEFSREWQHTIK
ncbi:MAG TPA: LacI family transcriptional regulator, partial [Enterococcus sp.]|nr:LacI family transcriptional regulator [Enterococcus sp.]